MSRTSAFDLRKKSALVTGATGYLGRAMAWGLAEAGCRIFVNGRRAEACEFLAQQMRSAGLAASPAPFDLTRDDEVACFFDRFGEQPLHVVVNNAYSGRGGTIETASPGDYREAYEISVVAAQILLKHALPRLRQAVRTVGDASVINIASMYGLVSPDLDNYETPDSSNPPFYGAAKAALLQFTRYAAIEFGREGIRVNAVAPGPFPSSKVQEEAPKFVSRLAEKVPMKRVGTASEVAGPVVFLAPSAASFVNGATLSVDGGWTSW